MKKYLIDWETDYCDNFPEKSGTNAIMADTKEEAIKKFNDLRIPKAVVIGVEVR